MLSLNQIQIGYGKQWTLSFPALTVPSGTHCLLLGPSGSGKSTLLHSIAGILKPQSGQIIIHDTDVTQLSASARDQFRAQHIGVVFQTLRLMPSLTVLENIALAGAFNGKPVSDERIGALVERVNLQKQAHQKPHQLSQGQAQRVAIARALLGTPPLILADEPTSSLDDQHCQEVAQLMLDTASESGASLIIATHDQRLKTIFAHQQIVQL